MASNARRLRATQRWGILAAVVVGMLGVTILYRWSLLSGFTQVQGDVGDGRFTAAVAAHWADPFAFSGGPLDLGIFFPATSTLGYSDTMFVFGLLAAPLIRMGLNDFVAVQFAYIAVSLLGYASAVAVLRIVRMPWVVSIPAAYLIVFSNAMQLASLHPQLLSLSLVPVIALLGVLSFRSRSRPAAMLWGLGAGLTFAVMTFTCFFAGWATVVTSALTLALIMVLRWASRRPFVPTDTPWAWSIGSLALGAITVIPALLWTYGDLLRAGASREAEVVTYLLRPLELVNVSGNNLAWGWLMKALDQDTTRLGEWWYAPTPLVLGLAVATGAIGLVRIRRAGLAGQVGTALVLAGLVTMVLPVRLAEWTPWNVVSWIPGTDAIRAVGRLEVVVAITLGFGAALVVGDWLGSRRRRPWVLVVVACLGLVLIAEQTNSFNRQQTSLAQMDPGATLPAPPAACTSFVLVEPFPDEPPFATQTVTQVIAQRFGIPTWNGYSGGSPEGWNLRTDNPDYAGEIERWRARNGIGTYCTLDLVSGSWSVVPPHD